MRAIFSLSIKDLLKKWVVALVMSLLFGTIFACYLAITAYQGNLSGAYFQLSQNWLVVQESDGVGEIHGSRLTTEIGQYLIDAGYPHPIPEIHQVVGTSLATGKMMRGVSLEDYQQVTSFTLVSGEALAPGSPSRMAMVGVTMAEIEKVKPGDTIRVRGRDFIVAGIFKTGTYQDNEVWISLSDAQVLLNYGQDVSIYIIPDGGRYKEGDNLQSGISVSRKGETGNMYGHEVETFYDYMGMVAIFAEIATIVTLTNLLWRLAWLRRHEFGIIRTLGFGRKALIFYLFVQAFIILLVGLAVGLFLAFTIIFAKTNQLTAFGLGVSPVWNLHSILPAVGIFLITLLIGIVIPWLRIDRMSIPTLLGRE